MPNYLIRRLLILGAFAIAGIIFIQSYWVLKTLDVKEKEFHQTVTIALRGVAQSLADFNETELPKLNLIQRRSSNYYAVNINDAIDAHVLEDYLIREFEAHSLNTDFEYAVYDCSTQDMVYGNYCQLSDETKEFTRSASLPTFDDLIYYFVVKFPSKSSYLLSSMWTSFFFSLIALLAISFFLYSIWVILRQKRLSEMQKDFINNMTHEFKTPISSIKIASEVIKNDPILQGSNRLLKYAHIIQDQNQRLNGQVEKVLTLAKSEKEGFKLNLESLNVHELLGDIVHNENMRLKQEGKGQIVTDFMKNQVLIRADKVHFNNLVYNVLDNAIKYTRDRANINISTLQSNGHLKLKITDQGIGIKKENISKLFKKFYRVPTGNLHDVKGFGLGLYYVEHISRAHGWKIDINSELGVGDGVYFYYTEKMKFTNEYKSTNTLCRR